MLSEPSDHSSASLASLKESLSALQTNTSKMLGKSMAFETRLENIDKKMKPIQDSTSKFMKAKENISMTLVEVGKTNEYFIIPATTEPIITGGLHCINSTEDVPAYTNYDAYFNAMTKLFKAKEFFESHREIKSSGEIIKQINSLLQISEKACNTEITRILTKVGLTIELVDDEVQVINPLSAEDAEFIKTVCNQLDSFGFKSHLDTFSEVRTDIIKEYLKSQEMKFENEWNSIYSNASIETKDIGIKGLSFTNKDSKINKNIMPYRRGKNPFKLYYDLVLLIVRGELQLWASIIPVLNSATSNEAASEGQNNRSVLVFVNICDAIIREMQRLLAPFIAPTADSSNDASIKKKSRSEAAKLAEVNDNSEATYDILKQANLTLIRFDILDIFNSKYDEFRDYCRPDVRHETTASYSVCVIRKNIVISLVENLALLMELSKGASSISQFTRFITDHKNDSTFPNITDIDPLTSGILHCCEELASSSSVFGVLNEMAVTERPLPEECSNVYSFMVSLIETLMDYLKRKADYYDLIVEKKPVVVAKIDTHTHSLFETNDKHSEYALLPTYKYVFLINNLYLLSSYLKESKRSVENKRSKSALLQSYYKQLTTFSSNVDVWFNDSQDLFFGVIEKAVGMAKSDLDHLKADITNDKSGKHRVLKSKFSVFNSGIDAFMSLQGILCIAAPTLREPISQRMSAYLLIRYSEFHGSYCNTNFSKKHQKDYVKYSPQDVERLIAGFFGK